jgi:hypothetical protein
MTPDSMPDLFPLYAGFMPDIILCRILFYAGYYFMPDIIS